MEEDRGQMSEGMNGALGVLHRLGIIMEPDLADPREAAGVLNPAVARGPDGEFYLLPRLVASGNYSRIGLARVMRDPRGTPTSVERLGVVLEPQASYELNRHTGGGVEDPRVTYLAPHGRYVMTYTALGPTGPRIAAAVSRDLVHWRRMGLVQFAHLHGLDLASVDNKDGLLFPEPVCAPDGRPALALIHRPAFQAPLPGLREQRPSMWISYAPLDEMAARHKVVFGQHHLLAAPQQEWECLKIGGGAPPVRTPEGWLVLYHGVAGQIVAGVERSLRYCAGVLLLDGHDPRRVLYRSAHSVLEPQLAAEREGVVPEVVFPTGVDARPDGALDLYYGMADSRIGVARFGCGAVAAPTPAQAA
jgi:predicted GH43/DUF377 family glycosyl hydrolase